ncbi:hypothetical protein WKW80_18510 [Variovorax humicola]|uniref:Uncharacterized protein n=1 Tax=Variovorax humicola TaxID=1769758 RepID=A0ABU8W1S8_9BURK
MTTNMTHDSHQISDSDADLLRASPFFDAAFYLNHNTDVAASSLDPIAHYLRFGAREGRDPGSEFSTVGYLLQYPDVAEAKVNPLVHFLRHGINEGRDPGTKKTKPSIELLHRETDAKFDEITDRDLLRQSSLFDVDYYLKRYPDVVASGMDPIDHFLSFGAKENRDPSCEFSTLGYLHLHEDVAASGMNSLVHYLRHGISEGRATLKSDSQF